MATLIQCEFDAKQELKFHVKNPIEKQPEKFIARVEKMPNNPQSSHDTELINALAKELRYIEKQNGKIERVVTVDEIREYSIEKGINICDVLDLAEQNNFVDIYKMGEKDILLNIWKRAYAKNNDVINIKDAVCAALSDCIENGHICCLMGRVNRYITSIAKIDCSDKIGKAATSDFCKNEIYRIVCADYQNAINVASESDDPDIRAIGLSYTTNVNFDTQLHEKFINNLKHDIKYKLDELYKNKYDSIKNEALNAII
jgi:hypothetical protein